MRLHRGGGPVQAASALGGARVQAKAGGPQTLQAAAKEQRQRAPAACTYRIHAGAPVARRCEAAQCGMVVTIPYVRISATGSCPSIVGQWMTEDVQPEAPRAGETPCPVRSRLLGAGCRIGPGGYLAGCADEFALCGGIDSFPTGTCFDRFRQQYFIGPRTDPGRRVIAVNHLGFRVTRSAEMGRTEGESTYRRTCAPAFLHEFDPRIQFPPPAAAPP